MDPGAAPALADAGLSRSQHRRQRGVRRAPPSFPGSRDRWSQLSDNRSPGGRAAEWECGADAGRRQLSHQLCQRHRGIAQDNPRPRHCRGTREVAGARPRRGHRLRYRRIGCAHLCSAVPGIALGQRAGVSWLCLADAAGRQHRQGDEAGVGGGIACRPARVCRRLRLSRRAASRAADHPRRDGGFRGGDSRSPGLLQPVSAPGGHDTGAERLSGAGDRPPHAGQGRHAGTAGARRQRARARTPESNELIDRGASLGASGGDGHGASGPQSLRLLRDDSRRGPLEGSRGARLRRRRYRRTPPRLSPLAIHRCDRRRRSDAHDAPGAQDPRRR